MSRRWFVTSGVLSLAAAVLFALPAQAQRHGGGGGHAGGGHFAGGHAVGFAGGHYGGGFAGGHYGGHPGGGFAGGHYGGGYAPHYGGRYGGYYGGRYGGYYGGGYYPGYGFGLGLGLGYAPAYSFPSYGYDYGAYPADYGYSPGYYDYSAGSYGSGAGVVAPNYADYSAPAAGYQSLYGADVSTQPAATSGADAQVRVLLPDPNATLWFQGTETSQRGTDRLFESPPLGRDHAYLYTVRVRWNQDGRPVEQTRQVEVHAGDRVTVDFRAPANPGP